MLIRLLVLLLVALAEVSRVRLLGLVLLAEGRVLARVIVNLRRPLNEEVLGLYLILCVYLVQQVVNVSLRGQLLALVVFKVFILHLHMAILILWLLGAFHVYHFVCYVYVILDADVFRELSWLRCGFWLVDSQGFALTAKTDGVALLLFHESDLEISDPVVLSMRSRNGMLLSVELWNRSTATGVPGHLAHFRRWY